MNNLRIDKEKFYQEFEDACEKAELLEERLLGPPQDPLLHFYNIELLEDVYEFFNKYAEIAEEINEDLEYNKHLELDEDTAEIIDHILAYDYEDEADSYLRTIEKLKNNGHDGQKIQIY